MKKKLILSGLWVIVSLLALLFEPTSLSDYGFTVFLCYYMFFLTNIIIACIYANKQLRLLWYGHKIPFELPEDCKVSKVEIINNTLVTIYELDKSFKTNK